MGCGQGKSFQCWWILKKNLAIIHSTRSKYLKLQRTNHGNNEGDYIIKGLEGEFYPCKPDIFHKSYNIINSDEGLRVSRDDLIQFLQGFGAWDRFYYNYLKAGYSKTFEANDRSLGAYFSWERSPEGHEFWAEVSEIWKTMLS